MDRSTPGLPVHHQQFTQSLPKLMSIELVMPSNHLILCQPLLLLPSIFPSIRVFSNESALCLRPGGKLWAPLLYLCSSGNEQMFRAALKASLKLGSKHWHLWVRDVVQMHIF